MMQTARYEEAVESLTQSIERNAGLAGSYYYRGVSLLSLEKYDEAIADFTASIEIGFLPQYCYYNRGVCYIQKVEYDEALNDFEKTLTEGDDPDLIQGAKDILWQLAAYYENQAALTETPEMRVADSDAAGQG
jgi:tetratricopeptide (TPR) repeat protein